MYLNTHVLELICVLLLLATICAEAQDASGASANDRVNATRSDFKLKKAKESAPLYSFAAWDPWGKICLLLKFDAMFTISYKTRYGKQQLINRLQVDAEMKGRCANVLDPNPVMDITWKGGFMFRMVFEKVRMQFHFKSMQVD
jgi:hypothetical protein